MPELRTVYFAPDGKYFGTYQECCDYEESLNLTTYLRSKCPGVSPLHIPAIAKAILEKYALTEHSSYVPRESVDETWEITCTENSPCNKEENSPNGTL